MRINDLGVLEHYTKTKGVGGRVKTYPEDFLVQEITPQGALCTTNYSLTERINDFLFKFSKPKKYVRATLVKKDFTTMKCIRLLESVMKTRIGYASLKDKRAVTAQRVSVPSKSFRKVKRKDYFLKNFEYNHNKVARGNLKGNIFTITVRDHSGNVNEFVEEMRSNNMFLPNFFGEQRFGSYRNTHLIGLHLVRKEYERAAEELLKGTGFFEKKFVKELSEGRVKAFRALGSRILSFYVHACQSYVFNKALSQMLADNTRLKKIALPGADSQPGKYVKAQLEDMKIRVKDFDMKELRLRIKGSERKTFMRVNDFRVISEKPLRMVFRLDKGSYASIVLNELCK
jgi:tRNA pseudouridine13 synthase